MLPEAANVSLTSCQVASLLHLLICAGGCLGTVLQLGLVCSVLGPWGS